MASFISRVKLQIRVQLAQNDALPLLALLGALAGALTSSIILLFRFAIEAPLQAYLPDGNSENFEALSAWLRFSLPLSGAIFIAMILHKLSVQSRSVGISHVLERLKNHQGHMPLSNFFVQFFGGIIAALSGQSTGREGPAVHLGAAAGSIMGRKLRLSTNHTQLLLASGAAAAISASFNTPIAAVVFAMEVIIVGYSLQSLIPVILASVVGTVVTRSVYGDEPAFTVPALEMNSFLEFPFLIVEALFMGALAALFIWVCVNTAQKAPKSLWVRFLIIGLINGLIALMIPQMMGIGYDTVNLALLGSLPWIGLFTFAIVKLLLTSLNLGLGQPGGAIGPMLFIGACAGGVIGEIGNYLAPDDASATGYYAMLGMAAMMSACLQAPLTGLMTLFELTNNPNIILPGMLVVVIANLTTTEVFKQKALFPRLLQLRGLTLDTSPVEHMLRENSVLSVANKEVKVLNKFTTIEAIKLALIGSPNYLIIVDSNRALSCISAADVATLLMDERQVKQWTEEVNEECVINLMAIPGFRRSCGEIGIQANLQEALDLMEEQQIECLTVHFGHDFSPSSVVGIVEHDKIHSFYRYSH
jgi:CIC family chloride channel protein